jgi:putative transposase
VACDPRYGIHRPVEQIKGRSSGSAHQEFPAVRSRIPTLRANSYIVATVGGTPPEVVTQYLADQRNA